VRTTMSYLDLCVVDYLGHSQASSSKHHVIVTEQSSTKPSLVSIGESFWLWF
jgi:hypothetical protein